MFYNMIILPLNIVNHCCFEDCNFTKFINFFMYFLRNFVQLFCISRFQNNTSKIWSLLLNVYLANMSKSAQYFCQHLPTKFLIENFICWTLWTWQDAEQKNSCFLFYADLKKSAGKVKYTHLFHFFIYYVYTWR